MTSNCSPGKAWFNKYARIAQHLHRASITCSYHREYVADIKKRIKLADKLELCQEWDIQVTINCVMVPEWFWQIMDEVMYFHERGINVTLKPQSDPHANFVVAGYTDAMLEQLHNGMPQRAYTETKRQIPKTKNQKVPSGPLTLVKCRETNFKNSCGLVQLKESYNPEIMYGQNYGYRSGLNNSMVKHLHNKVKNILNLITLGHDEIVVDIGSNDSTLLQAYSKKQKTLVGFDPTGEKFQNYYPDHISLIKEFFSAKAFKNKFGNKKAKIITSIAMFYDLERPVEFAREVYEILVDDGIWLLELSYLPLMLEMNSFDTICHEHLEYYGLKQIHWIMEKVGFKIIAIE